MKVRLMLFLLIFSCFILILNTTFAREISKSGEIYQQVKDGVVTVVLGGRHGSGFLIDGAGLIVTNSHVVRHSDGNVRVRFGANQVVKGNVIINDVNSDVAIILVNLKNIKKYKVLELFIPPADEPLVITGEKVLAIGSPMDWAVLEKTLTTGVVSKYQSNVIYHDTALNGGNSGGPLFNYDGKVIGINTFVGSDRGQALAGSVSINKSFSLISRAKAKITSSSYPSAELLPDVKLIPFPTNLIEDSYVDLTDKQLKKQIKAYEMKTYNYLVQVVTPPIGYKKLLLKDKIVLKKKQKRAKKRGYSISDDDLAHKNDCKYYNYEKPVVRIEIIPVPRFTKGTYARTAFSILVAASGSPVTTGVHSAYEFKKDFKSLKITNVNNKQVCEPLTSGKLPLSQIMILQNVDFVDSSYAGVYEYDPKCFDTEEDLTFSIESEGEKEKILQVKLKDEVKQSIIKDFKPYWQYVSSLERPKKRKPTSFSKYYSLPPLDCPVPSKNN